MAADGLADQLSLPGIPYFLFQRCISLFSISIIIIIIIIPRLLFVKSKTGIFFYISKLFYDTMVHSAQHFGLLYKAV